MKPSFWSSQILIIFYSYFLRIMAPEEEGPADPLSKNLKVPGTLEEIPRGETESRKVEWNREDLKWVLDLIERDSRYTQCSLWWAVYFNFSTDYDALSLKLKHNLEKRSKWQYWNIFQWALKSCKITAS